MKNRKNQWYVVFLTLFIASLFTLSPVYGEEKTIELQPPERVTPQQREEMEFQHFRRELKHILQAEEERIIIKEGVFIDIDTLLYIRRPIPDLPLRISIANATERDELLLREVRLLSPGERPIHSFSLYQNLQPTGKHFAHLQSLREELKSLERDIRDRERITLLDKERFYRIQEERAQLFSLIAEESSHIQATFDTTPYLKEVGDKATLTIRVSLTHNGKPFTVKRSFTYTRVPPFPSPSGWSRGDFHIHTVFSDAGDLIVTRANPYSVKLPAYKAGLLKITPID
jgi:hypothetical protein